MASSMSRKTYLCQALTQACAETPKGMAKTIDMGVTRMTAKNVNTSTTLAFLSRAWPFFSIRL